MLDPGLILQNRYVIGRRIGQGGMGAVYMAQDRRLHNTVAIKETLYTDERWRKAFEREAELLAGLHHPALPNVTDHFVEGDGQFLVMQFIPGEDLGDLLPGQTNGAFPAARVLAWADQLLDALDYLHTQTPPIIHRDIKPQNLKLTARGQIILLDFGLAKGTPAAHLSQDNSSLVGYTLNYAPLEQIQGSGTDARSDLYALAATLYHLTTGISAPPALARATAVLGGRTDPLRPAHEVNPQVPPALSDALARALKQNPADRFPGAFAMRQAINGRTGDGGGGNNGNFGGDARPPRDERGLLTATGAMTMIDAQPTSLLPSPDPNSEAQTVRHRAAHESAAESPAQRTEIYGAADGGALPASARQTHAPGLHTTAAAADADLTRATINVLSFRRRRRRQAAIASVAALVAALVGFNFYRSVWPLSSFLGGRRDEPLFQTMKISRLTNTGRTVNAAISPDGKYAVYVTEENGRQSLVNEVIATKSNIPLVAAADVRYWGITFSRDGDYVYYVVADDKDRPVGTLYQIAAFGGAPRKLIEQVDTPITLAPDGERFAFVNSDPAEGQSLIVANKDGTGRRRVATRKYPDFFQEPSWSPDGRTIACVAGSYNEGFYKNVVVVDADGGGGGEVRPLSTRRWWGVERAAWLPDSSGLVLATRELALGTPKQITQLSYPGGEARPVTNDLNDYGGVTLTADAGALVTIQTAQASQIWLTASGKSVGTNRGDQRTIATDGARAVTAGQYDWISNIAWASGGGQDGKGQLVYASTASGRQDLWAMNVDAGGDTSAPRQLTADAASNTDPSISADGRYIVFASNRSGAFHIWRMDRDGGNLKQLTGGQSGEWWPTFTPDGKSVIYSSFATGRPTLWKISIDGGDPAQLTDTFTMLPVVSPDGRLIACYYWDGKDRYQPKIAVLPAEGGRPVRVFDVTPGSLRPLRWSPDGREVTYIDQENGVSNVWSVSPDGGAAPRRVTDFEQDRIFSFAWSPDGRDLAVARGKITNDAVMLSEGSAK